VLARCRDRFQAAAEQRQVQIHVESPGEPCPLYTDRMALRTILDNLVSNAIRYTRPSGEVRLAAWQEAGMVTLQVADNGIGISTEDQKRIFERFYRVDRARSRELGGTGLGLSIVKHTVHALGGSIELDSKPGQGSRFRVILPRRESGPARRPSGMPGESGATTQTAGPAAGAES
jgi:signal transduction histidine kinase